MKETFVSFEIAKKLQEKGFKEKCLAYYDVEDNVGLLFNTQYTDEALPCQYTDLLQCHNTGEAETQPDDSGFCVDAATIPQALKWLREVKKIYVDISLRYDGWDSLILTNISTDDIGEYVYECVDRGEFPCPTYEQAAMEGIAYCLDHII